jgi:hypothetical protein
VLSKFLAVHTGHLLCICSMVQFFFLPKISAGFMFHAYHGVDVAIFFFEICTAREAPDVVEMSLFYPRHRCIHLLVCLSLAYISKDPI